MMSKVFEFVCTRRPSAHDPSRHASAAPRNSVHVNAAQVRGIDDRSVDPTAELRIPCGAYNATPNGDARNNASNVREGIETNCIPIEECIPISTRSSFRLLSCTV